ncbi:MAG: hypothetical protein O3B31_02900 [Chloroflexi bacterium]|nr:hypothetical protein [Chloroflexota bacterium]
MASRGSSGGRRSILRALADRLTAMTRVLPGVGRARPESFAVEPGSAEERLPMTDAIEQSDEDQTHPVPTRLERGHPKR